MEQTERTRWAAVLGRDGRFDGAFVYAVRASRAPVMAFVPV